MKNSKIVFFDGVCNSSHVADSDQDCNGDCCGGTPNDIAECGATFDSCGICSGGNSGHISDSDQDCNGNLMVRNYMIV